MSKSYFTEDKVQKELNFRKLFVKLWPYLLQRKPRLILVVILVLAFVSVSRTLPFLFGYAIDEGIGKKDLDLVVQIAIAYLVLDLLGSILAFFQRYVLQKLGNQTMYDIRNRLLLHVQRLPLKFFDKNPIGRIVTRVTNDVHGLGELFTQGFTDFFVAFVNMGSILIALSLLSLPLTLLTILVAPVLIWISASLSKRIRYFFNESKKKLALINAYSAESISGMRILQMFDKVEASRAQFEEMSEDYKVVQLKTVSLFARLWPIVEAFNVGTVATAILFGSLLQERLGLSIGQIAAFILLVQGFFRPLRVILERYNTLQNSLASADRVFHLLDESTERLEGILLDPAASKGSIELKNVRFRYSLETDFILKDINLNIRAGERIALVGRTGSGKSSLVSVLQRMYEIESGQILLDGVDLNQIQIAEIRKRIGVVQQENFIFKGSIAANISLNSPGIESTMIRDAARRAHCFDLIEKHKEGLDWKIEENGANLSTGEKQLIAFARVLAFNPDILILDEATANIDSLSEQKIQQATEQVTKGRTSLIIAHRLSTIINCDRIILLDQGQILEQGSHHELMSKKGAYFELYQSQQTEGQKGPGTKKKNETNPPLNRL